MFLLDLTHSSHSRARSGIQRVARALRVADGCVPICRDPHENTWRPLRDWEEANLRADARPGSRGAKWPLTSRIAGMLQPRAPRPPSIRIPADARAGGLLVPEIFSADTAAALPALLESVAGPRAAIFHDALALKLPEHTPTKTVGRFPTYLRELLQFDGIAAVSDDSREALLGYWRWLGVKDHPEVVTIGLGIDSPKVGGVDLNAVAALGTTRPTLLSVGTIEGRKNHIALLEACESLWKSGLKFDLRLVGLPRPETAAPALARIRELQSAGRPIRFDGPATESDLGTAYSECSFTVYPSLMEGFGLPVLESIAHGKPCVCSARGALGESAREGGCLVLETVDATGLAGAIRRLVENPQAIAQLAAAARGRKLRSWEAYRNDATRWLRSLKRRG